MKVLCEISEREFWRLRGKCFPTTTIKGEHFAILFERDRLYLPSEGMHVWTFLFPGELQGGPKRRMLIEEHSYYGPSRRQDARMVVKSVCGSDGGPIDPVSDDPERYLRSYLSTVSRYDTPKNAVTIKELRVSRPGPGCWLLSVLVWRGKRSLVGQHSCFSKYLPVIQAAEARLQALVVVSGPA